MFKLLPIKYSSIFNLLSHDDLVQSCASSIRLLKAEAESFVDDEPQLVSGLIALNGLLSQLFTSQVFCSSGLVSKTCHAYLNELLSQLYTTFADNGLLAVPLGSDPSARPPVSSRDLDVLAANVSLYASSYHPNLMRSSDCHRVDVFFREAFFRLRLCNNALTNAYSIACDLDEELYNEVLVAEPTSRTIHLAMAGLVNGMRCLSYTLDFVHGTDFDFVSTLLSWMVPNKEALRDLGCGSVVEYTILQLYQLQANYLSSQLSDSFSSQGYSAAVDAYFNVYETNASLLSHEPLMNDRCLDGVIGFFKFAQDNLSELMEVDSHRLELAVNNHACLMSQLTLSTGLERPLEWVVLHETLILLFRELLQPEYDPETCFKMTATLVNNVKDLFYGRALYNQDSVILIQRCFLQAFLSFMELSNRCVENDALKAYIDLYADKYMRHIVSLSVPFSLLSTAEEGVMVTLDVLAAELLITRCHQRQEALLLLYVAVWTHSKFFCTLNRDGVKASILNIFDEDSEMACKLIAIISDIPSDELAL